MIGINRCFASQKKSLQKGKITIGDTYRIQPYTDFKFSIYNNRLDLKQETLKIKMNHYYVCYG